MRVDGILGKINIDMHLEGWWNDGESMDEIYWGLDIWGSRAISKEGGVEGFETFLGRCWEEDGVEAFGSLNINLYFFQYSSPSKETGESI